MEIHVLLESNKYYIFKNFQSAKRFGTVFGAMWDMWGWMEKITLELSMKLNYHQHVKLVNIIVHFPNNIHLFY